MKTIPWELERVVTSKWRKWDHAIEENQKGFIQFLPDMQPNSFLKIESDRSRIGDIQGDEWERFIDEACVELNVEVKTAENEVQDRKWREETACFGEEEHVGNRK